MHHVDPSVFFEHRVNQAMFNKGSGIPPYDPQELALKYIALAKSGQMPTDEQVEAVRTGVINYCETVCSGEDLERDIAGINAMWPEVRERLSHSIGLTQMMLDFGVNSRYFYRYIREAGRGRFAVILEAKDGYALPVSGEMIYEEVPTTDWFWVVCHQEPSHPARTQTDWRCQSLCRSASTIFEGGAGLLSAYRNYDYPLGKNGQRIVACDFDAEMKTYLPLVFNRHLEEYGIEYIIGDLLQVMDDPKYFGQFDVVRMTGLLPYYPKIEDKLRIMEKARRLLKDDGVIATDLWTMGMSLARTALIGLWPIDQSAPIHLAPAENEAAAVTEMDQIAKAIGLSYVYVGDVCNGNPCCYTQAKATPKCVIFLLGKNVDDSMFDPIAGVGSKYAADMPRV